MNSDEFETLLRLWGYAYGQRRPSEWDEDRSPTGDSPLARGLEFAPGRKVRRLDAAYRRAIRETPMWARDAAPCKESRIARGCDPVTGGSDRRFTPEVERMERTVMLLHRADDRLAVVIRAEYGKRGRQADKAAELGMGVGKFREAVAEGRGWLRSALEMKMVA